MLKQLCLLLELGKLKALVDLDWVLAEKMELFLLGDLEVDVVSLLARLSCLVVVVSDVRGLTCSPIVSATLVPLSIAVLAIKKPSNLTSSLTFLKG